MLRTALTTTLVALGIAGAAPAAQFGISLQVGPSYRPVPIQPVVVQRYYEPAPVYVQSRSYEVEYRTCNREPWRVYTCTPSHEQAHRTARYLRHQGYETRVDHGH